MARDMNFDISKEQWKRELRNKSPIYAACDENNNNNSYYMCGAKQKKEENDTDTDSGLLSLDGDTPRDKVTRNYLLDYEILLLRQDSGVSSESSDISSPCLRSSKGEQVLIDTMATKNKSLTRIENSKQVEVNGVPAFGQYFHSRKQNLQKAIPQVIAESNSLKFIEGSVTNVGNAKGRLVREKLCSNNKKDDDFYWEQCAERGKSDGNYRDTKRQMKEKRDDSKYYYSAFAGSSKQQFESMEEECNNNRTERQRETKTTEGSKKKLKYEKSVQDCSRKSQNLIVRDELCELYRETADKVAETVDQLLYKDLLCAHLTEEILNFSDNNFSIEEEMLDLEEKYLEDQIFNSVSLLQTLENIGEQQEVELRVAVSENKKIDIAIRERLLKLQHMERAFRNMKFKYAPKQLKRYCSVESLLSDKDRNEFEKKKTFDKIWSEIEELSEEISLV